MDLEELLIDEGVAIPPEEIRAALRKSAREQRAAVRVLVEENILTEELLAEVLARATGTLYINLDPSRLDLEVSRQISAAIAHRHMAVISPGEVEGTRLRVAFADPTDPMAVRAIERETGRPVQAVVATLSCIDEALARIYPDRGPETAEVRLPEIRRTEGELVRTPTQRLPAIREERSGDEEHPRVDTAPMLRLEAEATIEQRHEALLLALVERGLITHADYTESLRRLLSKAQ